MILTIELTPDEEERVRTAASRGIDVYALIKGVIMALPQQEAMDYESVLKPLFAEWAVDSSPSTELVQELTDWENLKNSMGM